MAGVGRIMVAEEPKEKVGAVAELPGGFIFRNDDDPLPNPALKALPTPALAMLPTPALAVLPNPALGAPPTPALA